MFELEDRPPFRQALVDVTAHPLTTFVPIATPALTVGVVLQLSAETAACLVSITMVTSGVGVWLQVDRYDIVSSGLLSIQSVNLSFVTAMITLGSSMKNDDFHEESIVLSLLNVSFVGAFLVIGSSFILPYLRRVVTPTISGVVVLMIGSSLVRVGTIDPGEGFVAKSSGAFGNYEHLGVSLLVLIVVIGLNCCRSPLPRMGRIAIGLYVGYIASLYLNMVDFSSMHNLSLITIPRPFKYGFSSSFHQFLAVGTIYLLSVLEAVGGITVTATVPRCPIQGGEYQSRLRGGILANGLVSIIAPATGLLPLTTLVQNNGIIRMTGVTSRYVGRTTAVMLVILGLFPMTDGFFTTTSSAALGSTTTLMFSTIAIARVRIIIANGLKRRETLIVTTSLDLGPGVSCGPEIFKTLPASIYVLVEDPICADRLTTILLNIILPGDYRQENVLPGIISAEEMD